MPCSAPVNVYNGWKADISALPPAASVRRHQLMRRDGGFRLAASKQGEPRNPRRLHALVGYGGDIRPIGATHDQ